MALLFYASSNPTKIQNLKDWLKGEEITLLTPKDRQIQLHVPEEGKNVIDNAILKVKAYYPKVQLPTLAHDTGLYLEGLEEALQPGIYVRRVGGRELNDEEVLAYYTSLSKRCGGALRARYYRGIALLTKEGLFTKTLEGAPMTIVDTPIRNIIKPGNPLDCVSIDELSGKCWLDLSVEEKNAAYGYLGSEIRSFLKEHLKSI